MRKSIRVAFVLLLAGCVVRPPNSATMFQDYPGKPEAPGEYHTSLEDKCSSDSYVQQNPAFAACHQAYIAEQNRKEAAEIAAAKAAWAPHAAANLQIAAMPTLPPHDGNKACAVLLGGAAAPDPMFGNARWNDCIEHEQSAYDLTRILWSQIEYQTKLFCIKRLTVTEDSFGFYERLSDCLIQRSPINSPRQYFQN